MSVWFAVLFRLWVGALIGALSWALGGPAWFYVPIGVIAIWTLMAATNDGPTGPQGEDGPRGPDGPIRYVSEEDAAP